MLTAAQKPMQRTTSVTVGLLFVAALGAAAVYGLRPKRAPEHAPTPKASASARPAPSVAPSGSATAEVTGAESGSGREGVVTEGFETFPDGGKVPELPASAPARVGFGAVIFTYQGSQGAPREARTKDEARKKAAETIELAQKDFTAAVAKGDHGSTTDAGRVPRGVLEPPIEYHLFSLEKAKVHPEPIDTPRGYWVLRRNE
jgi:hypothetical protein